MFSPFPAWCAPFCPPFAIIPCPPFSGFFHYQGETGRPLVLKQEREFFEFTSAHLFGECPPPGPLPGADPLHRDEGFIFLPTCIRY